MAENDANAPPKKFVPIGPGNHDRAWNDPPMFATEFNVTGKTPANKLNKRVAYPISASAVGGPTMNSSVLGPPGLISMGTGPPSFLSNQQQPFQPPPGPTLFPAEVGILGLGPSNSYGGVPPIIPVASPAAVTVFESGNQSLPLLHPGSIPSIPPLAPVSVPVPDNTHSG